MCGQRVDEFYLHQPDTEASLAGSLEAAHGLVQRGLVGAVGMSNYHAVEVARACALCAQHGTLQAHRGSVVVTWLVDTLAL